MLKLLTWRDGRTDTQFHYYWASRIKIGLLVLGKKLWVFFYIRTNRETTDDVHTDKQTCDGQ